MGEKALGEVMVKVAAATAEKPVAVVEEPIVAGDGAAAAVEEELIAAVAHLH